MARRAAPWRRGGAGGPWWSTVRGKQVWLAPGTASKAEADRALIRILAGASTRPVAALLGHRGIQMVVRVYDRTRERVEVLRDAILKARPA